MINEITLIMYLTTSKYGDFILLMSTLLSKIVLNLTNIQVNLGKKYQVLGLISCLKYPVLFVIHTSSPHRVALTLFSDLSNRVMSLLET